MGVVSRYTSCYKGYIAASHRYVTLPARLVYNVYHQVSIYLCDFKNTSSDAQQYSNVDASSVKTLCWVEDGTRSRITTGRGHYDMCGPGQEVEFLCAPRRASPSAVSFPGISECPGNYWKCTLWLSEISS